MNHMGPLIQRSAAAVEAARQKLTADEAHALRIAAGMMQHSQIAIYPQLKSGIDKLRLIERGGGQ